MVTVLCARATCRTTRHADGCTDRECAPHPARPAADGLMLCDHHAGRIAPDATALGELYDELGLALMPSGTGGERVGGRGDDGPPVPRDRVVAIRTEIRHTLVSWCRLVAEERGVSLPVEVPGRIGGKADDLRDTGLRERDRRGQHVPVRGPLPAVPGAPTPAAAPGCAATQADHGGEHTRQAPPASLAAPTGAPRRAVGASESLGGSPGKGEPSCGVLGAYVGRHAEWLAAHSGVAGEVSEELDGLRRRAWTVAYPDGTRVVEVGPCPSNVDNEDGYTYTHCTGTLRAIVRPADQLLPSEVVCDADPEHRWDSTQWRQLDRLVSGRRAA